MILTGQEISNRVSIGDIIISPFDQERVNPNSYNFRLDDVLKVYDEKIIDPSKPSRTKSIDIPNDGLVLEPYKLYLGSTIEVLGSERYVPTYAARSSVARMGMFINLSAPLGDIGFIGNWTIQLFCLQPVKVYAGMNIGQMMFWVVRGKILLYEGKYQGAKGPLETRIHRDFKKNLKKNYNPETVPVPVEA